MNNKVPEGWTIARLEDVLVSPQDLTYGVVQPGSSVPSGTPIVRVRDIRNGRVDLSSPLRIDPAVADRFTRSKIRGGELLISLVGTVGETAVASQEMRGWNTARAVGVARIREEIGARWVARALKEPSAKALIDARLNTTVQATLNLKDLRDVPIVLPPPEFRRMIASLADALDDKIESNLRLVSLISDLIDTHSEKHGAGLPAVPLGDIAAPVKDSLNPSKLGDTQVDHFSLPAFDRGARPERVAASSIMSNKLRVPQQAILLSRLNPRFNRTWWASAVAETSALASTEFLVLTTEDERRLAAIWLALRDPCFREEMPKRVTGTSGSHQRVKPDDVLTIEVPDFTSAPTAVMEAALVLLKRAEGLRAESARLSFLCDALLPELLSGRLRTPAAAL